MNKMSFRAVLLFVVATSMFFLEPVIPNASGADTYEIKAVSTNRTGAQWRKWDWLAKELDKRTSGRLKMKPTVTTTELGLKGTEIIRVLKTGVIDFAEVFSSYVAGDFPLVEAPDLPGVSSSYEQSRELYKIWVEKVIAPRENLMGGKILSTLSYNSIYVFTKFPLNSLDDLKGKKIRVFSAAMGNYVANLGMEPVSMPIGEVYVAVQKGIVDAIATGPDQVRGMSMWEIANNIVDLGFSTAGTYIVMSGKTFDKLPADIQKVLIDIGPELTRLGWDLGAENNQDGMALAKEKGMHIVVTKPEWRSRFKEISQTKVLPKWVANVGEEGRVAFNQFLGPAVGFQVK